VTIASPVRGDILNYTGASNWDNKSRVWEDITNNSITIGRNSGGSLTSNNTVIYGLSSGTSAAVSANNAVVIGTCTASTLTTANNSIIIGQNVAQTLETSTNTTTIGNIGNFPSLQLDRSVLIGSSNVQSILSNVVSIGSNNIVFNSNNVIIGKDSNCQLSNSVVIGSNFQTITSNNLSSHVVIGSNIQNQAYDISDPLNPFVNFASTSVTIGSDISTNNYNVIQIGSNINMINMSSGHTGSSKSANNIFIGTNLTSESSNSQSLQNFCMHMGYNFYNRTVGSHTSQIILGNNNIIRQSVTGTGFSSIQPILIGNDNTNDLINSGTGSNVGLPLTTLLGNDNKFNAIGCVLVGHHHRSPDGNGFGIRVGVNSNAINVCFGNDNDGGGDIIGSNNINCTSLYGGFDNTNLSINAGVGSNNVSTGGVIPISCFLGMNNQVRYTATNPSSNYTLLMGLNNDLKFCTNSYVVGSDIIKTDATTSTIENVYMGRDLKPSVDVGASLLMGSNISGNCSRSLIIGRNYAGNTLNICIGNNIQANTLNCVFGSNVTIPTAQQCIVFGDDVSTVNNDEFVVKLKPNSLRTTFEVTNPSVTLSSNYLIVTINSVEYRIELYTSP